jgi:succinate dehydrogenase flavin-adding protein (antitoxin of CptAB toxin-antitoxin module)
MKELDLMLAAWVRERYEAATEAERSHFLSLLELPDPELVRYLLGGERPDSPALAAAVAAVRASAGIMSSRL